MTVIKLATSAIKNPLCPPLSNGKLHNKELLSSVIGKPLRKIDAMAKCAGETVFADDLNLPRTIYAKLLRSPHPHARVLSINAARALKLDGVFAVITGEDLPEKFGIMPSTQDEEALAMDKVRLRRRPRGGGRSGKREPRRKGAGLILTSNMKF